MTLHLVLYLGAYPSKTEAIAAFRAWRKRFPVAGAMEWMLPSDFFTTTAKGPDDEIWVDKMKVDNGL